ncbi:MAG: hypothetical protein AAGJ83_05610, partial [Planctomycetota bacterium]
MMPSAFRPKFASKDRATVVDLLLVFSAVFTITLVTWPRNDSRQVLLVKDSVGVWQSRSLGIHDPDLAEIQKVVHQCSHPEADPDYATAKWRLETALHYLAAEAESSSVDPGNESAAMASSEAPSPSDKTAPFARLSDDVAVVSFEAAEESIDGQDIQAAHFESSTPSPTSEGKQSSRESDAPDSLAYWSAVVEEANARIQYYEDRSESLPVSIRETRSSGWSPVAMNFGMFLGLLATCGYMHWKRLTPIQRNVGSNGQPLRVLVRVGTYGGVVVWSL